MDDRNICAPPQYASTSNAAFDTINTDAEAPLPLKCSPLNEVQQRTPHTVRINLCYCAWNGTAQLSTATAQLQHSYSYSTVTGKAELQHSYSNSTATAIAQLQHSYSTATAIAQLSSAQLQISTVTAQRQNRTAQHEVFSGTSDGAQHSPILSFLHTFTFRKCECESELSRGT